MCSFNHSFYDAFMAPLENHRLKSKRHQLLKSVAGDVLEIGYGTGANLSCYPYEQIRSLTLLEQAMPKYLNLKSIPSHIPLTLVAGDVEHLPFENEQFDSVVFTLVFCSVHQPLKGLEEIWRVLKEEGRVYFIEHVRPVDQPYRSIFDKATPAWKRIANGCHLNRETVLTLQQSGFQLENYHRFYKTCFVSGIAKRI